LREVSPKSLSIGISSYIKSLEACDFKKFELLGKYNCDGGSYYLIRGTYFYRKVERSVLLLGKFNDGVINIKDHCIEVCGAKEDSSKERRSISFLYNANGLDIRTRSDSPIHHLDKIKEIHCFQKTIFKDKILDLIVVIWVDGVYALDSSTSIYYGHFNDGVL
jgi:hypothetical protein